MKDDYTYQYSHHLVYTFFTKRLEECTFLNLGVKGLRAFPFQQMVASQHLFHIPPAVTLTQISAYGMLKNLAVLKIMEAMRSAYAKKKTRTQSQNGPNKTWHKQSKNKHEYVKRKRASFTKHILFRWIWKTLLKCMIHFCIFFHNFFTQTLHPHPK